MFTRLFKVIKKYYKLIAIDFSRQQKLDIDPRAMHPINFTGNRDWDANSQIFFIIAEVKERALGFLKGTVKVLWFYFVLT